jgi:hypothetical protein
LPIDPSSYASVAAKRSRLQEGSSSRAKSATKAVKQQKVAAKVAKPVAPTAPETPEMPSGPISRASKAIEPAAPPTPHVFTAMAVAVRKEDDAATAMPTTEGATVTPVSTNVVYVCGFPVGSRNMEFKTLFKQFGGIERVDIYEKTRNSKKYVYAYIMFKEQSSAAAAVATLGLELGGVPLTYELKNARYATLRFP